MSRLDKDATAERVRVARARAGMTLREVSEGSRGLSPVTLSEIERGLRTPRMVTLKKIARGLGIDVGELMSFEDVTTAPKAHEPQPVTWEAAVREARRVRENGRADAGRRLWAWRGAKRSSNAEAAGEHLEEIGKLLQGAYDAVTALWNSMSPGEDEWRELTEAEGCYRELIDKVEGAGLRVRRKRAGESASKKESSAASEATDARHEVEEEAA